jgi:phosphoenolpyruvate carboxykinase (GTP)
MVELLTVDTDDWRKEVPLIREYYASFGDKLPAALSAEVDRLEQQLG